MLAKNPESDQLQVYSNKISSDVMVFYDVHVCNVALHGTD